MKTFAYAFCTFLLSIQTAVADDSREAMQNGVKYLSDIVFNNCRYVFNVNGTTRSNGMYDCDTSGVYVFNRIDSNFVLDADVVRKKIVINGANYPDRVSKKQIASIDSQPLLKIDYVDDKSKQAAENPSRKIASFITTNLQTVNSDTLPRSLEILNLHCAMSSIGGSPLKLADIVSDKNAKLTTVHGAPTIFLTTNYGDYELTFNSYGRNLLPTHIKFSQSENNIFHVGLKKSLKEIKELATLKIDHRGMLNAFFNLEIRYAVKDPDTISVQEYVYNEGSTSHVSKYENIISAKTFEYLHITKPFDPHLYVAKIKNEFPVFEVDESSKSLVRKPTLMWSPSGLVPLASTIAKRAAGEASYKISYRVILVFAAILLLLIAVLTYYRYPMRKRDDGK